MTDQGLTPRRESRGTRVRDLPAIDHETVLGNLFSLWRSGDEEALKRALFWCDNYDLDLPKWVRKGIAAYIRADKKRSPEWKQESREKKLAVWTALHLVRLEGFKGETANRMVKRALARYRMNYAEDSIPKIARRAMAVVDCASIGDLWFARQWMIAAFGEAEAAFGTDGGSVPCLPAKGLVICTHDDPRTIALPAS